jgi:hypothetical protein
MNPIAIKYPLDLTGIAPNNLVIGEPHTLITSINRAFVPNYGPFYVQGLILTDVATGENLTPSQYVPAQLEQDITAETGLDVCQVIVITDPTVSNNVSMTYQVVGGEYSYSVDALIQMLAALNLDNRTIAYGSIIGLPTEFPPTPHLHDIGDTYGWEYVVNALESVRQAILTGDDAARQNLLNYINSAVNAMQTAVAGFNDMLRAHTSNFDNPHQDTKDSIGLGLVQNYGVASATDVSNGTASNLYVTPAALAGLNNTVSASLTTHINNHNNPHQVTATQVNLGNVANYAPATTAQAQTGTINTAYMTPLLTAAAITAQALAPLNIHVARTDNPHNTTAAQLGVYTTTQSDSLLGAKLNVANPTPSGFMIWNAFVAAAPTNSFLGGIGPGNADGCSQTANNVAVCSWQGIGFAPGIAGQPVANGQYSHWFNVRTGGMGMAGNLTVNGSITTPGSLSALTGITSNGTIATSGIVSASAFQFGNLALFYYGAASGTTATGWSSRVGSGTSNFKYLTFSGEDGSLTLAGGKMISVAGFQPSDSRLKNTITPMDARPIWRNIAWTKFFWNTNGELGFGPIADNVLENTPEYVDVHNFTESGGLADTKIIDKTAMALEAAWAAGKATDAQQARIDAQDVIIAKLLAEVQALKDKLGD